MNARKQAIMKESKQEGKKARMLTKKPSKKGKKQETRKPPGRKASR